MGKIVLNSFSYSSLSCCRWSNRFDANKHLPRTSRRDEPEPKNHHKIQLPCESKGATFLCKTQARGSRMVDGGTYLVPTSIKN